MQLFIGGACAGRRDAVAKRFPTALWKRLAADVPFADSHQALAANTPLAITGVLEWLRANLGSADTETLRQQWQSDMTMLCQRADQRNAPLIIIATEIGRGIVPMQPEQRQLRDLNGWFTQDAAAQADQVWYVRHGLMKVIKS
ncbi:MAG TPA: adenosylcobinamide kinase [Halomonas sp.]|nr:bifunctional adenosylcobinamide kinase/adenosylcobinamide-phosphate guanylyltransferase [Halomonas sp.]HDZ45633.1 adenosylcobinamide kinase [Halomonas sp.]HEB05021.1 adenosylcobinamide kinase [Halomonas sp.]